MVEIGVELSYRHSAKRATTHGARTVYDVSPCVPLNHAGLHVCAGVCGCVGVLLHVICGASVHVSRGSMHMAHKAVDRAVLFVSFVYAGDAGDCAEARGGRACGSGRTACARLKHSRLDLCDFV